MAVGGPYNILAVDETIATPRISRPAVLAEAASVSGRPPARPFRAQAVTVCSRPAEILMPQPRRNPRRGRAPAPF
jgi:hypothetical protein